MAGDSTKHEIYQIWKSYWHAEIQQTDQYLCEVEAVEANGRLILDDIITSISAYTNDENLTNGDDIQVCLAFDQNLITHINFVIMSAMKNASGPIKFHFLTRGVSKDDVISELSRNNIQIKYK